MKSHILKAKYTAIPRGEMQAPFHRGNRLALSFSEGVAHDNSCEQRNRNRELE